MKNEALEIIYKAITPAGILASSNDVDNYARVWSRDSMMTGLCGLIIDDDKIIEAHLNSIKTLARYQSKNGQLPSNVKINVDTMHMETVSFGTTVGRVDATTWWLIGTLSYIIIKEDQLLFKELEASIISAFDALEHWEFNDKGLVYTPLGGNWADEYICDGYTLYDNALRVWAYELYSKINASTDVTVRSAFLRDTLIKNFNITNQADNVYHFNAFDSAVKQQKKYLPASLNANGYMMRWDMAGNAIAMLIGANKNIENTIAYLHQLNATSSHWLLPVFYPVIHETDADWAKLNNNYSYNFKNKPFHFHNGGSWPIFLGWLCLALKINKDEDIIRNIFEDYTSLLKKDHAFKEYINTNDLVGGGTSHLCFSAVGYLFMEWSNSKSLINLQKLL
jgi:Alkaline and neutral invertase